MRLMQGNEACALGAIRAGCRFFAGYPITPASEIMEWMSRLLPSRDGVFVQMEDEIGALAAVIGAAWTGAKAMTATSGPGFSLMQENLGYAAMTGTPCVIVDSQRAGPSTGMPTLPAQGDVMQARWGSHGDRPAIVLTASSVRDTYETTVTAFNLAETHRVPVVLLLDALISHLRENVELPETLEVIDRTLSRSGVATAPFAGDTFVPFGSDEPVVVTGLAHAESGLPATTDGPAAEAMLRGAVERIEQAEDVVLWRGHRLDDADVLIVAYGITSRSARAAVDLLRAEGPRVGLLELRTLWPFPEPLLARLCEGKRRVVVPEMNLGQLVLPVRAAVAGRAPVVSLTRADGGLFSPDEIARAAMGKEEMHVANR